jgi:hypothetical protein
MQEVFEKMFKTMKKSSNYLSLIVKSNIIEFSLLFKHQSSLKQKHQYAIRFNKLNVS